MTAGYQRWPEYQLICALISKSVGPRDDFEHTVMSHNQISGNGEWNELPKGIFNRIMKASGKKISHNFHSSIPPLYVLSSEKVVPVILVAIKPVYRMLTLDNPDGDAGQPLKKLVVISIPNGLLLEENPGYLKTYPSLLFPGKDDKSKDPRKVRSRISFSILKQINNWRVKEIIIS